MQASRGLGSITTSSFFCMNFHVYINMMWRGTSGTASLFGPILVLSYPYCSSWAGSRWIYSLVKWSEQRQGFFVGTKVQRLQNIVHAFLRIVLSLENARKHFTFLSYVGVPNCLTIHHCTFYNHIMIINLFVTGLHNWSSAFTLSRFIDQLTPMARKIAEWNMHIEEFKIWTAKTLNV